MREFGKSRKLDNVLYDVRGPVVDEAARMEENGTNVLKLNIGNPAPFGFRTPDEVIYDIDVYKRQVIVRGTSVVRLSVCKLVTNLHYTDCTLCLCKIILALLWSIVREHFLKL